MTAPASIIGAGRGALKKRLHAIGRELQGLRAERAAIMAELARRYPDKLVTRLQVRAP